MRRVLSLVTSVALFSTATLLVGIASCGQLQGFTWAQQFTLYLVLIGTMIGIALTATALAFLQNWFEKN